MHNKCIKSTLKRKENSNKDLNNRTYRIGAKVQFKIPIQR